MKKKLLAMMAMAAALFAQAAQTEQVELLTNGGCSTLAGWENSGFTIDTFNSKPCITVAGGDLCQMSQTVTLANFGFTENFIQSRPTVNASVSLTGTYYSKVCNVMIYELDANGNALASHRVMDIDVDETSYSGFYETSFSLGSAVSSLKFEVKGQNKSGNSYDLYPMFLNFSMAVLKPVINIALVSEGTTVGTVDGYLVGGDATPTAPIPTRNGDYTFLGYYTEDGTKVFDASCAFVQGSLSGISSDVSVYARWLPPAGSVAKLVYRGQLTKLGQDVPPESGDKYEKTMHFRVYDSETAETPIWKADNQTVTVNKDGSFTATFGDETLAELIATGSVSHVGVAIGSSALELKPRRALRPVASVNRALVAEAASRDVRIGNLVTENALAANNVSVSQLEVNGTVTAPGAGPVEVSPVVVGERETLTLLRGDGVNVFSKNRIDLGEVANVLRGQKLKEAPSDGIALITSSKAGVRGLRIPGVIQYCRQGDWVRAPASEPDGVKVTFFPFIGDAR